MSILGRHRRTCPTVLSAGNGHVPRPPRRALPASPRPPRPAAVDMLSPDPHQWTYSLNVHSLSPALDMSLGLDSSGTGDRRVK